MLETAFETLLKLPHIRVVRVKQTTSGDYIVTLESTLQKTTCRKCKRTIDAFHSVDTWIMLQHLPICGSRVFIRLQPKRFRCPYCSDGPTTTQELPWYRPRGQYTKAYEEYLLMQCVNSTITDVSIKERLGYDAIEGLIDHYIAATIDWNDFDTLEVLGIDEIALKKGHRSYAAVVTTRQAQGRIRLLAVLPDRTKATVLAFFRHIPYRLRRTVTSVCSDMYEGYLAAIQEIFGADAVVIDRFHVAQHYHEAADDLRKQEMARLKGERKQREYELLKGVMWYFRKKPAELEPDEEDVLECLFSAAPQLRRAYQFREDLTAIFDTAWTCLLKDPG